MISGTSNKLIETYAGLVSDHLDRLPVNSAEDLDKIKKILQEKFLNKKEVEIKPEALKRHFKAIDQALKNPKCYLRHNVHSQYNNGHYDLLKRMIMERIAAKVTEIASMTECEKMRYIEAKREGRKKINVKGLPHIGYETLERVNTVNGIPSFSLFDNLAFNRLPSFRKSNMVHQGEAPVLDPTDLPSFQGSTIIFYDRPHLQGVDFVMRQQSHHKF